MCRADQRSIPGIVFIKCIFIVLALAPAVFSATEASRLSPYPNYEVGDTATLIITTAPAQPFANVYRYRLLNGTADGDQPTLIGVTDADGIFISSATLPASAAGHYTGEYFAVSSAVSPPSNTMNFFVHATSAPTVDRPAPYPSYEVGDTASLTLTTDPAQPFQPVYRFREYNNEAEDPIQIGTTDEMGSFQASAVLSGAVVGDYSEERFTVGTLGGPPSVPLAYDILPSAAPTVTRPAPFPTYHVGDPAALEIETSPAQPNQPVYRFRLLNGMPEGGVQPTLLGETDAFGRFVASTVLPASTIGHYSAERFAVGHPEAPMSSPNDFVVLPSSSSSLPNVLVIMVDDLDEASFDQLLSQDKLPHIQQHLVEEGVRFTESFVSNPLCCPSRASFLTGQYSHNHGVGTVGGDNGGYAAYHPGGMDHAGLGDWLQAASLSGYYTALVGKYKSGYNKSKMIPSGWDFWRATVPLPDSGQL